MDVFTSTIGAADIDVAQNAARDLPATFSEAFDASWRYGLEWHNSAASFIAQNNAFADYSDYVRRQTGEQLPPLTTEGGGFDLDGVNLAQAKISERFPDLGLQPLSQADLDTMTRRRMAAARDTEIAIGGREKTVGGSVGGVLGGLASGFGDPVLAATLPLGGMGELGIVGRALEFAVINAGTEATVAGLSYQAREAAAPGSSAEIPGQIAGAALFGAGLGGAFGLLGRWLGHGQKPLPTALREDLNAATSDAQLNSVNTIKGAAAEAAHRDGVTSAVQSLVKGDPVTAGADFPHRLPDTVERLTELQLRDIAQDIPALEARAERARAALDKKDTKAVAAEVADLDRGSMLADLRKGAEEVSGERQTLQQRIDTARDTTTSDRLAAIEGDLQAPALPARRAAELRQERATITETLLGTSERDGRELGSLEQEAQGLDAEIKRRAAAADRLQRAHDRSTEASAARRKAIDTERETVDATLASQREIVRNELRRSIGKLAAEGYGVKLDRAEAQDLADIVIGGKADDASLAHVTETLVSKSRDAATARAADAGERHLRPLTFDERPQVERFDRPPAAAEIEPAAKDVPAIAARDLTPEETARLAADPKVEQATDHDLQHLLEAKPDQEFSFQVRQPDGSYQLQTRKLADVMKELDELERAGKEIEACAITMQQAAE